MAKSPNTVFVPAVPQINVPPANYDQNYMLQMNNILRLYFQQLGNAVQVNTNNISSNTVLTWLNQ